MKNIIKFNGKLYAPLEEGAHTIQGEIIEVSLQSSQDKLKVAIEALEKIANWETSEHPGANGNLFSLCREFAEKALESLRGAV